jgi:hypothetical protein
VSHRLRLIARLLFVILLLAVPVVLLQSNCPTSGLALSAGAREFVRLKNRTALPQREDFDESVTLSALLAPGDDRTRWLQSRAAAVEGYVLEVGKGGIESANCFRVTQRDIHIDIALRADAPSRERVVVEVTPRMIKQAEQRGVDWSEAGLRREIVGRWCRFEGWLLFDLQHADESENTAPGKAHNWRATAWEIHPVTGITVTSGRPGL